MNTSFEDCASEVIGMSRKSIRVLSLNSFYILMLGLIIFAGSGAVLAANSSEDERVSISRHHVTGGRDNPTRVTESEEQHESLITSGDRSKSKTRGAFAKPGAGSSNAQSGSFDFWFYEADVILFSDDDNDGYFYGLDVLFDVDTIYSFADVYAVLYLSYEGGPWNEYTATEDFTISGSSGSDEYVIVSELMSGYPTGSYDLLIELFDAYDGTYLASFGPADTSELGYLPLEDFNRDAPAPEVIVVSESGGGGAIDSWMLAGLLLLLVGTAGRKIWRRRNDELMRIDSPAPIWRTSITGEES
jgi:hypothetical protein